MTPEEHDRVARVGRAVRVARRQAGLSARTLAARAGISQAFLSQVERGLNVPSLASLYKIADALDCSPSYFLDAPSDGEVLVVRADRRSARSVTSAPSTPNVWVAQGNGAIAEVYQYVIRPGDDVEGWFRRADDLVLVVVSGCLEVQVRGRAPVLLDVGDCLFAVAGTEMRWEHRGVEDVRVVLCVAMPGARPVTRSSPA
ncbi:helix-turn-helix domain-containing protein [Rhodococcus coprophilus]|uniref:Transcriptional regulator n=1 Tax=Rhodococcus coprophilus TaxID=38310 RepID=A0A2X4UBW0_9NOCA|nr:helix-turn-helix domain-containing protein [Rhodococcus coprophilus]MBM7457729.1 transcriptional regulator with XRE-family HTH domain [Rhodococcus coprophilus]SQI30350.1 transcriptional regulator [Rhodococcus coprophilus]